MTISRKAAATAVAVAALAFAQPAYGANAYNQSIGSSFGVKPLGATVRAKLIGNTRGDALGQQRARTMDQQAARLESALPTGFDVYRVGEGIVVTGLVDDGPNARWVPALPVLQELLRDNPEVQAVVVGHGSGATDSKAAMQFSYEMAELIRNFLVPKGVDSSRVRFEARGSQEPIASNAEASGRTRNSRIEIGFYIPYE